MSRTRSTKGSVVTIGTKHRIPTPAPLQPGERLKFVEVGPDGFKAERVREVEA